MSGWAAAGAAAGNIFGGWLANRSNAKEAKKNRAFQERMSNTAHTREAIDLKNAGLNRILSVTKGGGASTPGGAMAVHKNIAEGAVSSAKDAMLMSAQLKNLDQQTKKLSAETTNVNLDSGKKAAENQMYGAVTNGMNGIQGFGKWLGETSAKAVYGLQQSEKDFSKWKSPKKAKKGKLSVGLLRKDGSIYYPLKGEKE